VLPCEHRASIHDQTRKAVERLPAKQARYLLRCGVENRRKRGSAEHEEIRDHGNSQNPTWSSFTNR